MSFWITKVANFFYNEGVSQLLDIWFEIINHVPLDISPFLGILHTHWIRQTPMHTSYFLNKRSRISEKYLKQEIFGICMYVHIWNILHANNCITCLIQEFIHLLIFNNEKIRKGGHCLRTLFSFRIKKVIPVLETVFCRHNISNNTKT